ncbi:hypothetical protein NIES4073_61020 [Kalymmatonema gypsitolerans NIES-4073]|nr:hypothetical protein NIES4073_61020 [Scytonema sp. NIES-4073]
MIIEIFQRLQLFVMHHVGVQQYYGDLELSAIHPSSLIEDSDEYELVLHPKENWCICQLNLSINLELHNAWRLPVGVDGLCRIK